jgi:nitrogen fixation NifU-like protein
MSGTADIYQALIMQRARTPRHAGKPARFEAEGQGDNPLCGDKIHLYVAGDEIFHDSRGCAIMTASADLMADAVAGLSAPQIADLRAAFEAVVQSGEPDPSIGDLNALAGVSAYRSRIRCATLPWMALTNALEGVQNHG